MQGIIIDTGVLSVPPYVASEDDALQVVSRIARWSSIVGGDSPVKLFGLNDSNDVLALCGAWPLEADVRQMLEMYGLLEVFSPNDILRSYFSIIGAAIQISTMGDEVTACSGILIEPDVLHGHTPEKMVASSKLSYANSCYRMEIHNQKMPIASGLPHAGSVAIKFQGRIDEICGNSQSEKVSVSGTVHLLDIPEDLSSYPSSISIWNSSISAEDYFLALSVKCIELQRESGIDAKFSDLPAFFIGSEFVQSLGNVQAAAGQPKAAIVMETCSRLIIGTPKHPIKQMGKKTQSSRSRDHALGWRTHISKRHEALRLMFWTQRETIELANVAVKFDTEIEAGNQGDEYSYGW